MGSFMLVLPDNELNELKGLPQEEFQARVAQLFEKYPIITN
jgi:hypothetical protein